MSPIHLVQDAAMDQKAQPSTKGEKEMERRERLAKDASLKKKTRRGAKEVNTRSRDD